MAGDVKWCCPFFFDHHGACGERGLSVFAKKLGPKVFGFVLQHRSIDKGADLTPYLIPFPVTLVGDVPFRYCPWCGVELLAHYRKVLELVDRSDLAI